MYNYHSEYYLSWNSEYKVNVYIFEFFCAYQFVYVHIHLGFICA